MKNCYQNDKQSVYDHGIAVRDNLFELINILKTGKIISNFRIPNWLFFYSKNILNKLYSKDILEHYTIYHDCGKAYCLTYDVEGKKHFKNHAIASYNKWLEIGGNPVVAELIKMDMDIHLLKDNQIEDFCQREQAITLLLTGLAEIHANAEMFGGIDSLSFKIKYKQIEKRGNKICSKIFGKDEIK